MTKYFTPLILFAITGNLHAGSIYNITASAGLMLDDNITRAQYNRDIYDDFAIFAGVSADYNRPASEYRRLQITVSAETWHYQDASLGHELLSLQGDYIFQPTGGYTAPWYNIYLLLGVNSHDSEYRDGSHYELGTGMGKRITDATGLHAGISRQQITADDEIFSLDTTRLFANLDFRFGQNTVYTTLAYSTGDIVVTVGEQAYGNPYPPNLSGIGFTGDDAFPWLVTPWAYKLDADTWSLRIGYVHALASHQSIDASLLRYASSAYGGNDYDGMITSITYFYRF
ncbi:MAG: hypothetical protein QG652_735 [Pseudomonadota bacterium]|nr:hypothetical protein [Pseudomonadota bacterium]